MACLVEALTTVEVKQMLKLKISQALPNPLQIHLECEAGQLHALVGPSGSGKTSTLRTIAGLSQAKTGRIQCDDEIGLRRMMSPAFTSICRLRAAPVGFCFSNTPYFHTFLQLKMSSFPCKTLHLQNKNAGLWHKSG